MKETRYKIITDKVKKNYKILIISDYHNCNIKKINNILNKIICKNYDYIFLVGDICTVNRDNIYSYKLLDKLNKFNSVISIFGNHDIYYKDILTKKFKNIKWLDNQLLEIEDFEIYGLTLSYKMYKKLKNIEYEGDNVYFNNKKYKILLVHTPKYIDEYIKRKPNLIISGHFHGGVIRIFNKALISSDLTLFPKYSKGMYKLKNICLLISGGIFEHFPSIRINNPPEVIELSIIKK